MPLASGTRLGPYQITSLIGAGLLLGLALGAVAWFVVPRGTQESQPKATHVQIGLEPAERFGMSEMEMNRGRPSRTVMAMAPDGRAIVFAGERYGVRQLFMRSLDRDAAVPVDHTSNGDSPFFSPDGRWIGFWSNGKIRKVPATGGPATDVCDTARPLGIHWSPAGAIVFGSDGIKRVADTGGPITSVTTLNREAGEISHRFPWVLPDGRIIFTAVFGLEVEQRRLMVTDPSGGAPQALIENATDGRYLEHHGEGFLVFSRLGALMGARFDPLTAKILGSVVGAQDDLLTALNSPHGDLETGAAQYAFSNAGHLAYVTGGIFSDPENLLIWFDRKGRKTILPATIKPYQFVRLLPNDSSRLMTNSGRFRSALWTFNVSNGQLSKIDFEGRPGSFVITPDGRDVIVSGSVTGPSSLYRLRTDGTGTAQRLTTGKLGQTPTGWTPDGSELIFLEGGDIYALSMSALTVRPIVVSPQAETHATISPDGKWIAYGLNLSGRSEVFVQPYPGLNGRIQVSTQGGHSPRWTKGGRELLYYQANGISEASIMVVDVTASANFQRPAPRTLFTAPAADLVPTTPSTLYDVTPNGDRIFTSTLTNRTPPAPTKINLILNWFDELRAKISGGENPQ